jgi:hypothetical protein
MFSNSGSYTVSAYCFALLIPSSFSNVKKAVTGLFKALSFSGLLFNSSIYLFDSLI